MLTRCYNTSPIPCRHCGRCGGCARRAELSRLVMPITGDLSWFPRLPALDLWLRLYDRAARANGGEPDAGRRLLSWALAAGFDDITPTGSIWCFATAETRDWWGGMWADRILQSDLSRQLVDSGMATTVELKEISAAWRSWAGAPDSWLAMPHGEILCRA